MCISLHPWMRLPCVNSTISNLTQASSMKKMLGTICGPGFSHLQKCMHLILYHGVSFCILCSQYEYKKSSCSIFHNCVSTCSCRKSVYSCMWVSLHCIQNIIFTKPWLPHSTFTQGKEPVLSKTVYILKCMLMWKSTTWISLLGISLQQPYNFQCTIISPPQKEQQTHTS